MDVVGLLLVSVGWAYLSYGRPVFQPDFPSSAFEAIACLIVGAAIMVYAAGQIIKEMIKQVPPPEDPEP